MPQKTFGLTLRPEQPSVIMRGHVKRAAFHKLARTEVSPNSVVIVGELTRITSPRC
jgi:hypothetical protein